MWQLDPTGHYKDIPHARLIEALGLIPSFIETWDPENKTLQKHINVVYAHGGGWHPLKGFSMDDDGVLTYPEDPPLHPIVKLEKGGLVIRIYESGWTCILDAEGNHEVTRMD